MITGPRVSRKSRTAEFDYQVESDTPDNGPDLAEDVEEAVLAVAPSTYRGWPLDDVTVGPEPNSDRLFRASVRYAAAGGGGLRPETGDVRESWTTGGGTAHIKSSLETVETSAGAPDHDGAINVIDGKIEGADVIEPRWAETVTKYIANGDIAAAKAAGFACTGHLNDDEWRGFAAGEVLLVEVVGQKRSEGDWEVTYRFECKPNLTSVEIAGGTWTIDELRGWDLVWLTYLPSAASNQLTTKASHYYVERVHPLADFDALDLE